MPDDIKLSLGVETQNASKEIKELTKSVVTDLGKIKSASKSAVDFGRIDTSAIRSAMRQFELLQAEQKQTIKEQEVLAKHPWLNTKDIDNASQAVKTLERDVASAVKNVEGAVSDTISSTSSVVDIFKGIKTEASDTAKALDTANQAMDKEVSKDELLVQLDRERQHLAETRVKLEGAQKAEASAEKRVLTAEGKWGADSTGYKNAQDALDSLRSRMSEYTSDIKRSESAIQSLSGRLQEIKARETTIIQPQSLELLEKCYAAYEHIKGKLSEVDAENAKIIQNQLQQADKSVILVSKTEELRNAYNSLTGSIRNVVEQEQAERQAKEENNIKTQEAISKLGVLKTDMRNYRANLIDLQTAFSNLGRVSPTEFSAELRRIADSAIATRTDIKELQEYWAKLIASTRAGLSGEGLEKYDAEVRQLEVGFQALYDRADMLPQAYNTVGTTLEEQIAILKAYRDELAKSLSVAPAGVAGGIQREIESITVTVDALETKLAALNQNRARAGGDDGVKGVFSNIEVGAEKAEQTVIQLIQRVNELKTKKRELETTASKMGVDPNTSQEYRHVVSQLNAAEMAVTQYYNQLNVAKQKTSEVSSATTTLARSARGMGDAVQQKGVTIGDVFNTMSKGAKRANNAVNRLLASIKSLAGGILNKIRSAFDRLGKSADKAFSSKNFKRGLTTLLKYTLGVRSLYFAFRRLRNMIKQGLNNLVQYDSANNQTNTAITELRTSLLYLKNAWGAAFAPIINAVYPVLVQLMDMLAAVGNAIARFMAALTGQASVLQAVRVGAGDYAQSLAGAGGSAKKAADEQKKLNDRLAAFDDLNVLGKDKEDEDDKSPSGGGGGGYNPNVNEMFTRVDTPISRLADMIRQAWDTKDGFNLGQYIGESLSNGFDSAYQWLTGEGYRKAMEIANLIGTFFDGLLSVEDLGTNFGKMIGAAIVLGLDFINTIITPHRLYLVGVRIAEALNAAIPMIVPKLGETLGNLLHSAINAAYGFLTTADFASWGEAFGQAINNFFEEMGKVDADTGMSGWQTLGTNIKLALRGALIFAMQALDEIDTQEIIDAINEFFEGLDLESLKPTLRVVVSKLWNMIREILAETPLGDVVNAVIGLKVGGAVVGGLGSLIPTLISGSLMTRGITTAVTGALGQSAVTNAVGQAVSTGVASTAARTSLRTVFSQAFGGAFSGFGLTANTANMAGGVLGQIGIGSGVAGVLDVGALGLGVASIAQGARSIFHSRTSIVESLSDIQESGGNAIAEFGNAVAEGGSELLHLIPNAVEAIGVIHDADLSFDEFAEGVRLAWSDFGQGQQTSEEGVRWAQNIVDANEGLYDSYVELEDGYSSWQEQYQASLRQGDVEGMQQHYADYYRSIGREAVDMSENVNFAYQQMAETERQYELERQQRIQEIQSAPIIDAGERARAEAAQAQALAEQAEQAAQRARDIINAGQQDRANQAEQAAQVASTLQATEDRWREYATQVAESAQSAEASMATSVETMRTNTTEKLSNIGSAFTTEVEEKASPVADNMSVKFTSSFDTIGASGAESAKVISDNFTETFGNIDTTATNTWTSIKGAFSEGGDVFTPLTTAVDTTFKSLLNGVVAGMNTSITTPLRSLSTSFNSLRNVDIAGLKPFAGIPVLNIPQIPYLAQGAVIPPNKEFMAVLGDQSHGTNIEAPLDTIRQAVGEEFAPYFEQMIQATLQVVQAVNNKNLVIGDREIGKANARYESQQALIRGTML